MCSFANTVNAQKNFMEGWDGGDAVDVGSEPDKFGWISDIPTWSGQRLIVKTVVPYVIPPNWPPNALFMGNSHYITTNIACLLCAGMAMT
mgnify:CR=1 FL=1